MAEDYTELFRQLEDRYQQSPKPPAGMVVSEHQIYLHYKAFTFLSVGPAVYREFDYFGRPPAEWPEMKLAAVQSGAEQLFQWRGFTPEAPLREIGIGGFYALAEILHIGKVRQRAFDGGEGRFLDEMVMQHVVNGWEVTLYNLVDPRRDQQPVTVCPHCGKPLRTPFAKQCRFCKATWHAKQTT